MKLFYKILMALCAAVTATAAVPDYMRTPFTTNTPTVASNVVRGIALSVAGTNQSVIYAPSTVSALRDSALLTNTIFGQAGVTIGGSPGDYQPYLFWAKGIGGGMTNWGVVMNIPGGIRSIGEETQTPTNSNPVAIHWYLNGNPQTATRSNIVNGAGSVSDSDWFFHQVNPYGSCLLSFPMYTTNAGYANAGTPTSIMTNSEGAPIYIMDPFGLTIGSINPEWPPGITNQAGMMGIILGGAGLANPFHIAANMNISEPNTAQHSFFTIDRRGTTNVSLPLAVGFPTMKANNWEPTQANWAWTFVSDLRTGSSYNTNAALYATNFWATTAPAHRGNTLLVGPNYDPGAAAVFQGSVSFNDNSVDNTYTNVLVFDAAQLHRLGLAIRVGQFSTHAHGSGSPWTVARSSAADLLASAPTQTFTEELIIDSAGNFRVLSPAMMLGANTNFIVGVSNGSTTGPGTWTLNRTTNGQPTGVPVITVNGTNGYIGIGTTTPANVLQVAGTVFGGLILGQRADASVTSLAFHFDSSVAGYSMQNASGNLKFLTGGSATQPASGTEVVRFDSTGKVGIGTASPTAKLDVTAATATPTIATHQTNAPVSFATSGYTNTTGGNVFVSIIGTALTVTKKETNGTTLFAYGSITGTLPAIPLKPWQWVETSGTLSSNNVEPW